MPLFQTNQQRAALLILLLGAGLLWALLPFVSGLIGGLVLYVLFQPAHQALARRVSAGVAAGVVVALVLLLLVIPGIALTGLIVDQAGQMATTLSRGELLSRLAALRVGEFDVGSRLAAAGEKAISQIGSGALSLIGTATRFALNLTISLFCLYFLLLRPAEIWNAVKPFIPFSEANTELLRVRFRDVTISTVIGTGLTAVAQGTFVAMGLWLTGIDNPLFWGVVALVFSILPVVGSGLIWGPAVVSLVLAHHYGAAAGLLVFGVVVVGQVDLVIRPLVYRRYAQIHPLVTLIGALAGLGPFGLIGLLLGPLAISYFFELIRMYREETRAI